MTTVPNRVLVISGSGISAESGVPTFRGKDGYWRNLDPTKLATVKAFESDPGLVWQWYRERRELIRRCKPNAAHNVLVGLADQSRDFLLLTQNVDDLHTRARHAGHRLPSDKIVQIHGDIYVTRCSRCDYKRGATQEDSAEVPICPKCSALMRPGVVWFDEELEHREVERVEKFLSGGDCEAVLVIGTTALFDYVFNWALAAKGANGRLIEINPEETRLSPFANETIRAPAAMALPPWVNQLVK